MTEDAADMVCRKGVETGPLTSPDDFRAANTVLRSQGPILEIHPNLAKGSVNSAFDLAEQAGDLEAAWKEFYRTLCKHVPAIKKLKHSEVLENWDSSLEYPKNSFWYTMRAETKAT